MYAREMGIGCWRREQNWLTERKKNYVAGKILIYLFENDILNNQFIAIHHWIIQGGFFFFLGGGGGNLREVGCIN